MNPFLDIKPEVIQAIAEGKPVVALESTIISHGMPYPQNVETALTVERIVRETKRLPGRWRVFGAKVALETFRDGLIPPGKAPRYIQTIENYVDGVLQPLIDQLFAQVNPIPVKAACAMAGLCREQLRLPLVPLEEPHRGRLHLEMEKWGLVGVV